MKRKLAIVITGLALMLNSITRHQSQNFQKKENLENKVTQKIILQEKNGAIKTQPQKIIAKEFEKYFSEAKVCKKQKSINGIRIYAFDENIKDFLGGKKHGIKDYFSFDENTLIFSGSSSQDMFLKIEFDKNNPYIKIEEGDELSFYCRGNSQIILENRDSEGLIPKIIINEDVEIQNGGIYINYAGVFKINPDSGGSTSPLEIFYADTNINEKVFVDNFNRAVIAPKKLEEYVGEFERIDVKFSSRIKYNYLDRADLEVLLGKPIEFKESFSHTMQIKEGNKQKVLGRLRDYWETLTPETKESIQKIEFSSDELFEAPYSVNGDGMSEGDAGLSEGDGTIAFRASYFRYYVLKHEAGHQRHFVLMSRDIKKYNTEIKYLNKKRKQSEIESEEWELLTKQIFKVLKEREKKLQSDNKFNTEWEKVAGKYNKTTKRHKKIYYKKDPPEYFRYYGPLFGYVHPYGGSNVFEDVATFSQKSNEPEFFKDLINPESKNYDEKYRKKLDLLYEYKFILQSEYNEILQVAGVKQKE